MIEELLQVLVQIPGSTFMWYFAGMSILCILIGWMWKNADGSTQYALPELTKFDAIAIAALSNGKNAVIRTAVFSLWNKNLIDFRNEGKDTEIVALERGREIRLGNIEDQIYRAVQEPTKSSDIFIDKNLLCGIESYLQPIYTEMENLHLLRTEEDHARIWNIFMLMATVITAVGGAKLYFGITGGKPVGFLIMLLIGSLIVLYAYLSPESNQTALGKQYLKTLEEHFGWIGEAIKETRTPQGIDPSFAIAIFGIGILGTSLYDPFKKAFAANSGSGSGGCGGGCGGGGGGCGGCGGCGG